MKTIVVPGELVSAERKRIGSNVYIADGKIYSKVVGVAQSDGDYASVVALTGKYFPQREDTIIGVVTRVVFAGYGININSFTETFIPKSAVRDDLKLGDVVAAKVEDVNELREVELAFPRKMFDGNIIEVIPVRTPRLIGKSGSMLDLLKQGTGSEIIIGKNGRVWARGGDLALLTRAVKFIEKNSYKSNLTNAIEALFGVVPQPEIMNGGNAAEESEVIPMEERQDLRRGQSTRNEADDGEVRA